MRILLLGVLLGLGGCATLTPATGRSGVTDNGVALALSAAPAQASSGRSVQKRGLPLTRVQKIVLWTSVAVLLGYVIAESADEENSAPGGY